MKRLFHVFLFLLLFAGLFCVTAAADAPADTDGVISYVGLSVRTRGDYVGLRSLYEVDDARIAALEDAGHRVTYGALMGIGEENGTAVLSRADMTVSVADGEIVAYGAGTRGYRCAAVTVYDTDGGYHATNVYASFGTRGRQFAFTTLYTGESESVAKLRDTAVVYRAFLIVDGVATYIDAVGDTFGDGASSLYDISSYFATHEPVAGERDFRMHPSIRRVLSLCMNDTATLGNGSDAIDLSVTHTLSDMRSGVYSVYADAPLSLTVNGVTVAGQDGYLSLYLSEGDNAVSVACDTSLTYISFRMDAELPVEDSYCISDGDIMLREGGAYRLYAVYTADGEETLSVTLGDTAQSLSLFAGSGYVISDSVTLSAGALTVSVSETDAEALLYLVRVSHEVSLVGKTGDIISRQKVYDGESAVIPTAHFGSDLLYFDRSTEQITADTVLYGFFRSQFDYETDGDAATLTAYTGSHDRLILPDTLDGYRVTAIAADALASATAATYLYLPDSIVTLESGALAPCTALCEIAVGEGNTAFAAKNGSLYSRDGKTLVRLAVGGTSGTIIEIESGVTALADYALVGANAKSVLLPTSVTVIGRSALSGMKRLVAVYYAGSLAAWGDVSVESGNGNINTSTLYYYSATKPASGDENNYWYYKNGSIAVYQNSSWTPPVA